MPERVCPVLSPGHRSEQAALLISLGERIGLHQLGGLVDEVILAIQAGAADARLAPERLSWTRYVAFRSALNSTPGDAAATLSMSNEPAFSTVSFHSQGPR